MKMARLYKVVLVLGIMAVTTAAFSTGYHQPSDPAATDTLLKDVTGSELQEIIESYEGEKAVLVNVWATWCAPCIEEFPEIVKLQRNYPDQLKVIFVSGDFP